jgi:hypothetical protein
VEAVVKKSMPVVNEELEVSPNCLLVFVDETGHEEYKNKDYPVFGFGGCAVLNSSYEMLIKKPWLEMKTTYFGGIDVLLHGSASNKYSQEQKVRLCEFFKSNHFFRFSHMMKASTPLPDGFVPYHFAALGLLKCVEKCVTNFPADSIAMIFEDSQRGNKFIPRYFSPYQFSTPDASIVPIEWLFMPKSSIEPGLEIADLIAHSTGAQTNARLKGKLREGKDIKCIFDSVDNRLKRYVEIEEIKIRTEL